MLHPLSYLLSRDPEIAEKDVCIELVNVVVPKLKALLEEAAEKVLENHNYDSMIAKDVAMEIMICELATLLLLSHVDSGDHLHPSRLTREIASEWLLPTAWRK